MKQMNAFLRTLIGQIDALSPEARQTCLKTGFWFGAITWLGVILFWPVMQVPAEDFLRSEALVPLVFDAIRIGLLPACLGFVAGFLWMMKGDAQ